MLSSIVSDPYKSNIETNLKINRDKIEGTENTEVKKRSPNYIIPDIFLE